MAHDLVIRGGTVVDGSGMAAYRADVGVDAGRITAVGRIREPGRQEIDAEGHAVTPGFVDGHTHLDAQVMWDPLGTSSCYHGVTTVVMGNCGFTLAPARPDARELVVRNLERAEDIDACARSPSGVDWELGDLRRVPRCGRSPTEGHQLRGADRPLGAAHVGDGRARLRSRSRTTTTSRLMQRELRAAMEAGAIGFTTSRIDQHETSDDRPVASRLASWSEVCDLVGVLRDLGVGVFEIAPGHGNRGLSAEERRASIQAFRDLAIESGVPMTFGMGAGPRAQLTMDLIDATVADGGRMFGQTHSRGIQVVLSFLSRTPFDNLPGWQRVRALPPDEQLHVLRDPDRRARNSCTRRTMATTGDRSARRRLGPTGRRCASSTTRCAPNPTIADVAAERGVDPVEVVLDLAVKSDLRQLFTQPLTATDDDALLEVMRYPALGDDLLRQWRAREPDLRLVDPDPPARVLGAREAGVQARGGRAHAHVRPGHRSGASPTAAWYAKASSPTSTWSTPRGRAGAPHRRARPPGRRAATRAAQHRLPRHDRERRARPRRGRADRQPPGPPPPQRPRPLTPHVPHRANVTSGAIRAFD